MRRIFWFLLLAGLLLRVFISAEGSAAPPKVDLLRVDGAIVPVVGDYIDRGLAHAEERGVPCIIELSTPGGLYGETEKIVGRIIKAEVPVVVYVNRWAGSAGTFITIAAHVAAMAPGSRIGAAHPVAMGTSGGEMPETQKEKITEDAAAWIRSLAEMRGRDSHHAEMAVRESKSYTDNEALENNLIDLRADNLADLISQLDGMKVKLSSGEEVTLKTADSAIDEVEMTVIERFLHAISDPNIAYILLTIGTIGIIAEIYNPGAIFPGIAGAISLLLAFYSLGVLDAYWGGVLLILLSFGLFLGELFTPTFGLFTAGGITSLTVGSLILFSGSPLGMGVSPGLIAGVVICVTALFALVIWAVIRAHRRRVTTGREGLMGKVVVAKSELDPAGTIFVDGERWIATVEDGKVEPGEEVVITRVDGLRLIVRKNKPL